MKLTLIAAIGKNRELGKNNDMIWHLPQDLKFFRKQTSGHTIVMGRKTFESLPGMLPKRHHVVISRSCSDLGEGIEMCSSVEEFIKRYKDVDDEIYCIGGVQNCCDKFIDCSPFKVIAYFQHAEFVITDTFHGTIMSIITHKRFVSLVRKNGYGNFEKLTDLLNRINLTSRIIENITFLDEILNNPINYDDVDNIIQKELVVLE